MDKDWLIEQYWTEGKSSRAIAKEKGVSYATILYWMRKFQIPRRTKSEALAGEKNPMFGKTHSAEAKKKIAEASKEMMKDPQRLERLRERMTGENNPMFGKTHSANARKAMSAKNKAWFSGESGDRRRRETSLRMKKFYEDPANRKKLSEYAKTRTGSRNPFWGKTHTKETRDKIARANRGRFVGEKGANWQGGKTSLNIRIRQSYEAQQWRRDVMERDAYTCQNCEKIGGRLHVDHIKPFSLILQENDISTLEEGRACDELWDTQNGRVLCVKCHRKTDTYAGRVGKYLK